MANPFYKLPSGSMVSGPTERLIEEFFGPRNADHHVNAYRWHVFTGGEAGYAAREAAVKETVRQLVAMRRATA
jgi:hypothetical protein